MLTPVSSGSSLCDKKSMNTQAHVRLSVRCRLTNKHKTLVRTKKHSGMFTLKYTRTQMCTHTYSEAHAHSTYVRTDEGTGARTDSQSYSAFIFLQFG